MEFSNNESVRDLARKELKHIAPQSEIKGFIYKAEDAKKLPKELNCKKHGLYDVGFSKGIGDRVFVNGSCSKCVQEFDVLLDEKEKELKKSIKEKEKAKLKQDRDEDLHKIGVSKRYINNSFDNYTAETPDKQNALLKCKELCNGIIKREKPCNLIMVGGVGTGKTHLANSSIVELYDNGKSCERINMIDMIRELKATWSKDNEQTEEKLIKYFTNIDLLIIDEVGIQFNSDTEKLFVFDIINGRYENCLPTVIISNLDINGVKDVIGSRCVDRLREDGGKVIAFNWESHR